MPFKKKGTGAQRPRHRATLYTTPTREQSKHEFEKAEHHTKHYLKSFNPSLRVMLLGHH